MTNLTSEQLSELSDFNLNKRIAKYRYPNHSLHETYTNAIGVMLSGAHDAFNKDYCNNYNDLLPLMIQHDVYFQIDKHTTQHSMVEALLNKLESS